MPRQLSHIQFDAADQLEKELRGKDANQSVILILRHLKENGRRLNDFKKDLERSQQSGVQNITINAGGGASGGGSSSGVVSGDSRSGYMDVAAPGTVTVYFSSVSNTSYVPQIPYVVSLDEDGNVQITLCVPVITATNDTRTATSFSIYVPIAGRLVWKI
jgi:hypothetical protein